MGVAVGVGVGVDTVPAVGIVRLRLFVNSAVVSDVRTTPVIIRAAINADPFGILIRYPPVVLTTES